MVSFFGTDFYCCFRLFFCVRITLSNLIWATEERVLEKYYFFVWIDHTRYMTEFWSYYFLSCRSKSHSFVWEWVLSLVLLLWHVLGGRVAVCLAVKCLNKFSFPAYLFQIIDQYFQWLFHHWEGANKREYVCDVLNLHWQFIHLACFLIFGVCLLRILLPLLDHMPGNTPHDPLQLLSFLSYAFCFFTLVLFWLDVYCSLLTTYMPFFTVL